MGKYNKPKNKKKQQKAIPVKTGRRTIANEANAANVLEVRKLLDHTHSLKNKMSRFCQQQAESIFLDAHNFTKQYKLFNSTRLNAWERQKIFEAIVTSYNTMMDTWLVNNSFRKGLGFVKTPKGIAIQYSSSNLSRVMNYLVKVPQPEEFNPTDIKNKDMQVLFAKPFVQMHWTRLVQLAQAKQQRMFKTLPLINYSTGTFRLHPKESHAQILIDTDNKAYQEFIQLRRHAKYAEDDCIRLPLKKCKQDKKLRTDKEFYLTMKDNKIHLLYTYEAVEPEFKKACKRIAFDANTKTNLLATSTGNFISYDELSLGDLVKAVTELGTLNKLTHGKQKRLELLCARNEARIKSILAKTLNYCVANDFFDVIVEDIDMKSDASFLQHNELKVKFSRLTRLLRLSKIKTWLKEMGEKRGIRVHILNPAYSSQECGNCHHISKNNRKNQAEFKCEHCGHTANADVNAAIVLLSRFEEDVLLDELSSKDKFGRAIHRKMDHRLVQSVVTNYWTEKVLLKANLSVQGSTAFP